MDVHDSLRNRSHNRQVCVQRRNLIQICRFAVKSLIDKASLTTVDDECEEVINFCAVLEQLLSHRLKAQKTWFALDEDQLHFWGYIKVACKKVPNSCINSIANLENVKSPLAKGRAWIRCVLMEKRLSEYLNVALQQTNITKKFYREGAVVLTEDANMLNGVLLGLNAIDFSFCLKGNNVALSSPLEIDFTPYLRFQQSQESLHSDAEELHELSTISSMTSSIMSEDITIIGDDTWKNKYKALETKYKTANEQKGYLEELGRMREQQLYQLQHQRQTLINTVHQFDVEGKKERHQLELVILELQKQLSGMKRQCENQHHKYTSLMRKLQSGHVDMEDVNIIHVPPSPGQSASDSHRSSYSSSDAGSALPSSAARLAIPGSQATQSSGQLLGVDINAQKEDTQSMIAMAGSFSSETSVNTGDTNHGHPTVVDGRLHLLVTSPEQRRGSSEFNTPERRINYSDTERMGTSSVTGTPTKRGIKSETGKATPGIAAKDIDHLEIPMGNTDMNIQKDVYLSTKEEEFVMVPEQAQEASAFISVTDTRSDQSEGQLQADERTNQSGESLQSVDLSTNDTKEGAANLIKESQDIANKNIEAGDQKEDEVEENYEDKDGSSSGSDDIMVLSDVSLTDTDGSTDQKALQ
ncbi:RUN domain-containing protein 3B-like [Mizuhopecten yessoensis]|uniref:RUN domain-containing protein 3B n=1 Tax=Mizuhopecten yessoensis TaxID=6573 RepID=A0A210PFS8_MIZYE|nr:RUN domain-containing protein 3B-like [Mizuhopecten yessoensis]OWF35338.1 RUN domain-containing protein 3B [Mizuhopecten yessoensis]